jgi:hypothetical protein
MCSLRIKTFNIGATNIVNFATCSNQMNCLFSEVSILGFDVGVLTKMCIRLSSTCLVRGLVVVSMKDLERTMCV